MRWIGLVLLSAAVLPGCSKVTRTVSAPIKSFARSLGGHRPNYWERYGKVYYLDGAGNLGFGQESVPKGLRAAGYRGDIEIISWTSHTGPLGDQMIRWNARRRADELTRKILDYRRRHPEGEIHIIGLSAGTGVGVWAVEKLPEDVKVDTLVLLGSSLSTNYDMTRCLRHVRDKVYVLYSPYDMILKSFIPVTGTIDGSYLVEPAGRAGLFPPSRSRRETIELYKARLENIPWRSSFERLGNAGGHTDGTNDRFVKYYIGPRLLKIGAPKRQTPVEEEEEKPVRPATAPHAATKHPSHLKLSPTPNPDDRTETHYFY